MRFINKCLGNILNLKALVFLSISVVFLSGCAVQVITPTPLEKPSPTAIVASTPIKAPTEELLPLSPTQTIEPTLSSLKLGGEQIGRDNADRIGEVAVNGLLGREAILSADGRSLYLSTYQGVAVYSVEYQPGNTSATPAFLRQISNIIVRKNQRWRNPGVSSLRDMEAAMTDYTLALNANGSRLAIATYTGGIVLDATSGEVILTIPGADEIALSPDGRLAAVSFCNQNTLQRIISCEFEVRAVPEGNMIYTWHGQKPLFSPDGTYLAIEYGQQVYLFKTSDWTQAQVMVLKVAAGGRGYKYFLPDSKHIALSMDTFVDIRQITDLALVREVLDFEKAVGVSPQLTFSQDSSKVALLDAEGQVSIWDIASGEKLSSRAGPAWRSGDLRPLYLTSNGELWLVNLPGALGADISSWDGTRRELSFFGSETEGGLTVWGHDANPSCVMRWDGNSEFFPVGENGLVWNGQKYSLHSLDANTAELRNDRGDSGESLATIHGFPHAARGDLVDLVRLYALSPAQEVLFFGQQMLAQGKAGYDLKIWDIKGERFLKFSLPDDYRSVSDFTFSPDAKRAAFLINTNTGTIITMLDLTAQEFVLWQKVTAPTRITFAGNDQIAYTQHDPISHFSSVHFMRWDGGEAWPSFIVQGITRQPNLLTASPDGNVLAMAFQDDGTIMLFDAKEGRVLYSWLAHQDSLESLAFSKQGNMLGSSAADGLLKVWAITP